MSASSMQAAQAAKDRAEWIHQETVGSSPYSTPMRQQKRRDGVVQSPASGRQLGSAHNPIAMPITTSGTENIKSTQHDGSVAHTDTLHSTAQVVHLITQPTFPVKDQTMKGPGDSASRREIPSHSSSRSEPIRVYHNTELEPLPVQPHDRAGGYDFANDPDFVDLVYRGCTSLRPGRPKDIIIRYGDRRRTRIYWP